MSKRTVGLLVADMLDAANKTQRHRIVHDYFGVDVELIWHICQRDIPRLIDHLQKLDTSE